MPVFTAEHEVSYIPPKFNRDELRRGQNKTTNESENKMAWKLLQRLEVFSTTYAMMVHIVALFALHI